MIRYLLRRLFRGLAILLGVVTLLFLIFGLLADPAQQLAGQRADVATVEGIRAELGLDKPRWQQYLLYLNDLSPLGWVRPAQAGDVTHQPLYTTGAGSLSLKVPWLRRSFQTGEPVLMLFLQRLPGTALLALVSLAVAALLGIGLGVLAGMRPGTWQDRSLSLVAFAGVSAPSFFMAIVFIWLFVVEWGDWTGLASSGYVREPAVFHAGYTWHWQHLLLPVLTLSIRPLAIVFQITRDSLIDTLRQDYIRTARAKGLPSWRIIQDHALRNSLNPVITSLTGWLASLLAGTFFVEYIFHWQGIGKLTIDALMTSDYPLLLGCCLCTATIFVLVNVLTDLLYAWLDPRVRLG
ncbi:MAG: ABC transporter permease [Bacteroidetes bacterium]|nr:ABC transporter permease [Bacteroidota bacterium]